MLILLGVKIVLRYVGCHLGHLNCSRRSAEGGTSSAREEEGFIPKLGPSAVGLWNPIFGHSTASDIHVAEGCLPSCHTLSFSYILELANICCAPDYPDSQQLLGASFSRSFLSTPTESSTF